MEPNMLAVKKKWHKKVKFEVFYAIFFCTVGLIKVYTTVNEIVHFQDIKLMVLISTWRINFLEILCRLMKIKIFEIKDSNSFLKSTSTARQFSICIGGTFKIRVLYMWYKALTIRNKCSQNVSWHNIALKK